jgi:hypothetical protein
MANSNKATANTKKKAQLSIAEETAIFLKSGGKIQQIPTGVSGQINQSGPKHIKLGNKNNQNQSQSQSQNQNQSQSQAKEETSSSKATSS